MFLSDFIAAILLEMVTHTGHLSHCRSADIVASQTTSHFITQICCIAIRLAHFILSFNSDFFLEVTYLSFRDPTGGCFYSGQWARIACDGISESEFHPFTITSAPYERRIDFHIR